MKILGDLARLASEWFMNVDESNLDRLDQATAQRLKALRSMPVDTLRLDRMIQTEIPRPLGRRGLRLADWLSRRRLAIAASFVALAFLGAALFMSSGGQVLASTADMAAFHEDMVSGRVPVMRVESMQAANQALAAQWAQSPRVPTVPSDHVMACCMRSVKNKKVACVLLQGEVEPVTMTVARTSDMRMPSCPVVRRHGSEFRVHCVGSLNMVMTRRQGCWVCLIGRLPTDRLMDLASSLQF